MSEEESKFIKEARKANFIANMIESYEIFKIPITDELVRKEMTLLYNYYAGRKNILAEAVDDVDELEQFCKKWNVEIVNNIEVFEKKSKINRYLKKINDYSTLKKCSCCGQRKVVNDMVLLEYVSKSRLYKEDFLKTLTYDQLASKYFYEKGNVEIAGNLYCKDCSSEPLIANFLKQKGEQK